jgi:hypothetical protein
LLKTSEKKNAKRKIDSINRIIFFLIGLPLMGVNLLVNSAGNMPSRSSKAPF